MPKTVIISDIHLTTKFDHKKYEFLKSLVQKYDQVIINGDFWSNYTCTCTQFLNSKWELLFPYLKNKTIYIHGNHDRMQWCTRGIKNFCKKNTNKLELKIKDKTLFMEHGHLIALDSITNPLFIKVMRTLKFDALFTYKVHELIIRLWGVKTYNKMSKGIEELFIEYANNTLHKDEIIVLGHTHTPSTTQTHAHYLNSGYIQFGHAYYLTIENGYIKFHHETY
ncbi:metallophosphoesterase family protein [candidate division WWE3 bacterium]|uniref:Metallophosphoesterase family protein n=1 Tax=candidate division WWE3 bacterium TaxID=2053526 RepID=A0A955EAR5_UNCKA|nr:metallophosphoesterase family protein [candidate division WWE3 bacterium]